jgi:hypothetical protein
LDHRHDLAPFDTEHRAAQDLVGPPTCSRSIRAVLRPDPASAWESGTPAWPAPITTAS